MTTKIVKTVLSGVCLAGMLSIVATAGAATYSLNIGNTSSPPLSGFPAPYGSVTVTLLSGNADAIITFNAGDSAPYHYLFGDGGTVGVNVNGAFSYSALSESGQPQNPVHGISFGATTNPGEDGWGSFNFGVDNFDGFGYSVRTVSFDLHKTTGTWSSDLNVLAANSLGYIVAAHIFVANSDWSNSNATGFATSDGKTTGNEGAPDGGSTVALLGFGLLGIGALRQRLGRK